ncbi:MAG: c-type cytochrome biogenesis protein CcmI [Nitrospirota bacterium]|nr:c-type cytochrome biogenesis protein CcmI [Nitrospirota bacterium]
MSTIFYFICFVILILVVVPISLPFWRKDPTTPSFISQEAADDQERADLSVDREGLRRSLLELDNEIAQGRLEQEDYERLKATDERRLLKVLDRLETLSQPSAPQKTAKATPTSKTSWVGAVASTAVVLVLSIGIYEFLQWRTVQTLVDLQTQMPTQGPDPREMVGRLEERLRKNPNDLEGQIMAGRSYMALQRLEDAQKAWTKVLELDPLNNQAHYHLGILLIDTRKFDDPALFQTALKHFDTVLVDLPNQPGVNWYKGLALWYLKRPRETEEAWANAYKNLTAGTQDREFIKAALTKLREGETPF